MDKQNKNKINYPFACVILAAGKGTRMKSSLPKVMHQIAGQPLIAHVLSTTMQLSPEKTVVVVAPGMESVEQAVAKINQQAKFVIQSEQLGTGHAVKVTEAELKAYTGKILILCGDTPLITANTLEKILSSAESADIVVLGMSVENPYGYGRLIVDGSGQLEEIIEERDATPEQKAINLCNSGIIAVSGRHLFSLLEKLTVNNNAGEYYLTDIVSLADDMGLHSHVVVAEASELAGINTREQLANAEKVIQWRLRKSAMADGVTMVDPASIFLRYDTKIAPDVVIHPQVVFGTGVTVESAVEIRSFSHIEGAHIKTGAVVGPFARLRPGTVIGENAHIGNFVELKNTKLGEGAKANHLSYVGDSEVGAGANIGAGTITCNYDGVNKHKTTIGSGAFIGSNTSLVAPVSIGANAVIGAGSVITQDVPDGNLALERSQQIIKERKAKK
jgi:bifunctional UDP-N-acetylglucosamine pyrophosphorylase / glucosamine-1-phosphate N-acetyltransferase